MPFMNIAIVDLRGQHTIEQRFQHRSVRCAPAHCVKVGGLVDPAPIDTALQRALEHEDQPISAPRVIRHQLADESRARLGRLHVFSFHYLRLLLAAQNGEHLIINHTA